MKAYKFKSEQEKKDLLVIIKEMGYNIDGVDLSNKTGVRTTLNGCLHFLKHMDYKCIELVDDINFFINHLNKL